MGSMSYEVRVHRPGQSDIAHDVANLFESLQSISLSVEHISGMGFYGCQLFAGCV